MGLHPLLAERITAALKSLPVKLCGYSGLMLPVCEDSRLAAAADEGRLSLQARCLFTPCTAKHCSCLHASSCNPTAVLPSVHPALPATLQSLLLYSAVCGVGLDTVPVPGATQQQPAAEREALLGATAAVLLDTAALAFRLGKPLSVRLLPVPGGVPGQRTNFDSPYLLNCAILPLA